MKKHILFLTMCFSVACTLKNTLYKDFLYYLVIGSGDDRAVIYHKGTNYIYYIALLLAIVLFYVVFRGKRVNSKSALMIGAWPGFYLFSMFVNRTFLFFHLAVLAVYLFFYNKFFDVLGLEMSKEKVKKIFVTIYESLCAAICAMLVFGVLPSCIAYNYQYRSYKSNPDTTIYEDNGENFVENSDDIIMNLNKDKYKELTQQERLDTLQYLLDVQMTYLGVEDKITLKCDSISGQGLGGYTNYEGREIVIDSKYMQEYREVTIHTVLHEAYHIYQHKCAELINTENMNDEVKNLRFFREVDKWRYEFKNYFSVDDKTENTDTYDFQSLEIEADAYAERWAKIYLAYVDK